MRFDRRTLRTSAAVAGIAVAGVGVVGPTAALAQPQSPPATDDTTSAAPDAGSTPNVVGEMPAPDTQQLPKLFTVENTGVHTAGESAPRPPAAEDLPVASASDLAAMGATEQVKESDVKVRTAESPDQADAMQDLDAASAFGDLARGALGATEGNTIN
ncbi:MAG: hypothetical protein ACRDQ0_19360 [Pseudonocardia sp.]